MNLRELKLNIRDELDKAERRRSSTLRMKACGMDRPGELDFTEGEVRALRSVIAMISCHGERDGECCWEHCPQLRDNEPQTSGRHCPLDTYEDEDDV